MIMGAELALTIMGLFLLIRGKGLGKESAPHPQYRLLGGFMLSVLPAALAVGFVVGVIWAVMHPDQTVEEMQKSLTFPAIGAELAIVAIYIAVAVIWEKSIKRKAGAGR